MTISKSVNFPSFEDLDKTRSPFDQMIKGIVLDLKSIWNDKEVKILYQNNMISPQSFISPSIMTNIVISGVKLNVVSATILYNNFKGGRWDHKVPLLRQRIATRYWHKYDKNSKGNPSLIPGFVIPGDNEYIYYYDFPGNISYGYTMKVAGFKDWIAQGIAHADDIWQWLEEMYRAKSFKAYDSADDPMVKLGIEYFNMVGDKPTEESFRKLIYDNLDKLRRYKRSDLIEQSRVVKEGDNLVNIARENGVSVEDIIAKNPHLHPDICLKPGTVIEMPSPDELGEQEKTDIDEDEYYVWRSVGDSRTRSEHAERDGKVFQWDNPPEGGHPGDDYGCRCFADPYRRGEE